MKKLIVSILMALAIVGTTFAEEQKDLFSKDELSISASSYGQINKDYNANADIGLNYYLTKNLGLDLVMPVYQAQGVSVDQLAFGAIGRIPIGIFAPYAGAGADYNWQDDAWSGYLKMGVELRVRHWYGLFAEGVYKYDSFNSFDHGTWLIGGGVRLVIW